MATRRTSAKASSVSKQTEESAVEVNMPKPVKAKAAKPVETESVKELIPKDVDPNTIVVVTNGFGGQLIYISPRTGEHYIWDDFGDEQEMTIAELKNAKSSAKGFYENNWFMFNSEYGWVIPYLGLEKYYKGSMRIGDLDKVFSMSPATIKDCVSKMPDGQKRTIQYRAIKLIADHEIDSLGVITALEEALGVSLIER